MTRQNAKTTSLTITAMLTAMVFAATTFFKVPVGLGYIHFGDVFVILGALMLPRRQACFAGGAGAMLADVIGGFAVWAPWTVLIKVGTVLFAAQAQAMIRKGSTAPAPEGSSKSGKAGFRAGAIRAAFYALAAVWTAAGYYVAEGVIYGNWVVPLAGIPFNVLQIAVGAIAAHFLFHVYARMGSAS